jgi:RNA polymerase sigma-54 factor
MSLSLRLDVRQTQGLVMTPQLQQAIKLLQLSNLELGAFVERELEQNPFLEAGEDSGSGERADGEGVAPLEPSRPDALDGKPAIDGEAPAGDGWSGAPEDGWADPRGEALPNGIGIGRLEPIGRGGSTDFADESDDVAERLSRPKSLQEHLLEQLRLDLADGRERMIGVHLIDLVDDAGYIRDDLGEVAGRLGCPLEEVEAVLARLQRFDPSGVCARSLGECLALQLRDLGRLDPAMQALLDHLPMLAQLDLKGLIQVCGVLPDDLPEMIAELKALNPKPGLAFAQESAPPVVPDIFVYQITGGAWRVELNSATLPRLLVNTAYYTELSGRRHDKRDKEYLSERFQSANWLAKALDQRARTVLKVTEAVVARQLPFLARGVHHLRPLVLRDIAEATGLHESTVSRATAGKYIATPRGNFPFKYFFSNALPGAEGEPGHAAEAIRQQIKALIEREAREQVLSDDQIVEILRAEGVAIARRTVAKYRESLGLPSSVQRRRAKALRLA